MSEKDQTSILAVQADQEQIEEAQNFLEAKAYYTSMIENKQDEVYTLSKEFPEIKKELKVEFNELDEILNDLQKDLNDEAANKVIVEAMIQNYRIKLQILEELLNELQPQNKDKDDEPTYNI